jgi:ABC-type bacteriocin/lantibiotic exporter with double-glycine peptidase domain
MPVIRPRPAVVNSYPDRLLQTIVAIVAIVAMMVMIIVVMLIIVMVIIVMVMAVYYYHHLRLRRNWYCQRYCDAEDEDKSEQKLFHG